MLFFILKIIVNFGPQIGGAISVSILIVMLEPIPMSPCNDHFLILQEPSQ